VKVGHPQGDEKESRALRELSNIYGFFVVIVLNVNEKSPRRKTLGHIKY
jgi:hypothetical protein